MSVYFFLDVDRNAVKIGFSSNIRERLVALRSAVKPSRLLGFIDGEIQRERELHRKFEADALGREWFKYSDELKKFILATQMNTLVPAPSGEMFKLVVVMEAELHRNIKMFAADRGQTIKAIAVQAIEKLLAEQTA